MSKFFKGLAASGAWVCFDEFNRLEINVLSIISQLIIIVQKAKKEQTRYLAIEGSPPLKFQPYCAFFITMNPFHFGRTPLPDNLKALFRQITMVVPDTLFISEIILYSVGFSQAGMLAKKIDRTFKLINEQLKFCAHYDFGLRTIKAVLVHAGQLKIRSQKVPAPEEQAVKKATIRLIRYIDDIEPLQYIKKAKEPKKDYVISPEAHIQRQKAIRRKGPDAKTK